MNAPFFNGERRARQAASFALSKAAVDENAAPGTVIGRLSAPDAGWKLFLADDAGGRFALRGSDLCVGAKALSRSEAARPTVMVAGSDGTRCAAALFPISVRRPMPALPLAEGARLMGFGHSAIDRAGWGTVGETPPRVTNLSQSNLRGVLPWIRLLDERFNLDVFEDLADPFPVGTTWGIGGAFQGISGDHLVPTAGLPGTLARTPYIASLRPHVVYLHIGENDVNSSASSAEEVVARLDRQLDLLREEGIWVVVQTLVHRAYGTANGLWPLGDARHTTVDRVNAWIKAQSGREGVKVCDTTALGFNQPGFKADHFGTDAIHLAPEGARAVAETLVPILREMVSPGSGVARDPAAAGNLWPNARLAGTGGARTSSSATMPAGQVANGHIVRNQTGSSTLLCSKETAADGFERQVVAVTPVNDATASRVHALRIAQSATVSLSGIGVAPGDWLETHVYLELSAWDHWLGASLYTEAQKADGTYLQSVQSGLVNPDGATRRLFAPGNQGFAGWIKVGAFQIPSGSDRLALNVRALEISWDKTGTGTGLVKMSKPILRKAASPKPAWSL